MEENVRNEALNRQWRILHRIYNHRNRGISKKELANEFQVSEKTIVRDVDNLERSGFPIYEELRKEDRTRTYYFMMNHYVIPQIQFSMLENFILYILMKVSSPLKGYFDKAIEDSFGKIYAQAPAEFQGFARKFSSLVLPDVTNTMNIDKEAHNILHQIIESILKNKKIKFNYDSIYSGKTKTHIVSPLCIKFHKNNFYLAGHLKRKNTVLIFALNRIHGIEQLNAIQEIVDFDPDSFFDQSFGLSQGEEFQVKLRFDKSLTQFVSERVFHKNQKITINENKEVILEMPAKSKQETLALVLSYMDKVEILEPVSMREEVKEILEKIIKKY